MLDLIQVVDGVVLVVVEVLVQLLTTLQIAMEMVEVAMVKDHQSLITLHQQQQEEEEELDLLILIIQQTHLFRVDLVEVEVQDLTITELEEMDLPTMEVVVELVQQME